MTFHLTQITEAQVIGLNERAIRDAIRKDPQCQQKHHLVRSSDLASCIGGIFYQSAQGFMHLPLEKMAGLLLFRIAQGQFFLDGNKRTALLACVYFLANNSYALRIERSRLNDLMWGFSPPVEAPEKGPRFFEADAVQYIFDHISPRQIV
jgi:Fic/DOC family